MFVFMQTQHISMIPQQTISELRKDTTYCHKEELWHSIHQSMFTNKEQSNPLY